MQLFVTAVWWEVLRVISVYAGRPQQQLPDSCQPRQGRPTAAQAAQPSTAANNVGVPAERTPAGSTAAPDHVISWAFLGHVTWTRSAGTRVYSCATTWRWCPTFTKQHRVSSASIIRLSPMVGVTCKTLLLIKFFFLLLTAISKDSTYLCLWFQPSPIVSQRNFKTIHLRIRLDKEHSADYFMFRSELCVALLLTAQREKRGRGTALLLQELQKQSQSPGSWLHGESQGVKGYRDPAEAITIFWILTPRPWRAPGVKGAGLLL